MQQVSVDHRNSEHPSAASSRERDQQRISMAGSFDRLVDLNLQLTKQVGRLVFVSWVMILFHVALLLFMIWRR